VKARLAILIVGTLSLVVASMALAASPTLGPPADGAQFTANVDQITVQAQTTSNASTDHMDFYISRDPTQVNANGVFSPFVDHIPGVQTINPTIFTGSPDSDDAWPSKPGTYWWQAVQDCTGGDPDCVSASPARSLTINPRPASTVGPGNEPNTFLNRRPRHRTHKRKVTFAFSSDVAGAHFRCLYAEGWSHCRSPHTFRHLKPGRYKFKAQAVVNGVKDPTPASWVFKVLR
jgi:hypothetical protein